MTKPIDVAGIGRWVAEWIGGARDVPRNDTGACEQRIETSVERLGHAVAAAIAKWGTPPAVAVEPFCYVSVNKQGDITRTMKRKDKWTNIPLYTTPPPTQAQAGAITPPPIECNTEELKKAYAFGWWSALEKQRETAQAGAVPLDEARRLFDAGWKAAALFCDREDVVADGITGFGACPQFEAAFAAANGIKGGQHG